PRTTARPATGPWTSPSCSASAAAIWPSRSARAGPLACRSGPGWPAGPRPPAMAAPCQRLGVDRVVLPDKLARPTLRDRVLGRTLADFQDRLSAKITLVNEHGAVVDA